jgi:hypothetical protein
MFPFLFSFISLQLRVHIGQLLLRHHAPARNEFICTPRNPNGTNATTTGHSTSWKRRVTRHNGSWTTHNKYGGWESSSFHQGRSLSTVRGTVREGRRAARAQETGRIWSKCKGTFQSSFLIPFRPPDRLPVHSHSSASPLN